MGSHPSSPAPRGGDAAGRMSSTSSVGVSPVREPPDVAEPHAVPDAGEEEIQAARPVPSVLGALGAQVPVRAAGAHQELRCHRLEERGSRGWERAPRGGGKGNPKSPSGCLRWHGRCTRRAPWGLCVWEKQRGGMKVVSLCPCVTARGSPLPGGPLGAFP